MKNKTDNIPMLENKHQKNTNIVIFQGMESYHNY